ncbi:DUF4304 domain-containing protein [Paenibacillus sp. BSR1-1]|uniref:DUF4304 domain-containing protein n=1 Tax=Paenibacillus sp. BSR1-1 TaxID=3020845 RepID=UPI0025B11CB1|nr:DUF4304 domain-containing protein [Paenibacillus sp. BSR1-1]MDN3015675.1 DUF4304 domain-containing protein [Paenibacillus sp. BSR1-1]
MAVERDSMVSSLKKIVIPFLRENGFKGSIPHFRRIKENKIDLVTFQFDRYGGGFVIEVAVCPPDGVTTHWGKKVPPNKVTAHDINNRPRLNGGEWFRYDAPDADEGIFDAIANEVLDCIPEAEKYWDKIKINGVK